MCTFHALVAHQSVSRVHESLALSHLGLHLLYQACPVVNGVRESHNLMQLTTSRDVCMKRKGGGGINLSLSLLMFLTLKSWEYVAVFVLGVTPKIIQHFITQSEHWSIELL